MSSQAMIDEGFSADEISPRTGAAETTPVEERYAVVEIFGHRKHVGRVMEVERYGAKMLRVDVPKDGDFALGYETHFYSGAAIFGETPCTLAMVKKANEPYRYSQPSLMDYTKSDRDLDGNLIEPSDGAIDEHEDD